MGSGLAVRVGSPGFGEPVVVIRSVGGGEDDYGDPLPDEESRTTIDHCAVAPLKSDEDSDTDGSRVLDGFTVFLPHGVDVLASDLLEVRGGVYHVDGVPGVWVNPYSSAHPRGVEVVVRRS